MGRYLSPDNMEAVRGKMALIIKQMIVEMIMSVNHEAKNDCTTPVNDFIQNIEIKRLRVMVQKN